MKNMKNLKEFKTTNKSGERINEDVMIMGNDFIVRPAITIPGSLVSQYMKKVKDENGTKLEDKFGKNQIAEMLVNYLATNFMNIENFPTSITEGTAATQVQPVQTQVQPQGQMQPQTQLQDDDAQNIQAQATAQDIQSQEGQGQIQGQGQDIQGQPQSIQGQGQGQDIQGTQTQAI